MLVILVYYAKIVDLGSSVNKIGKFIGLSHIKRQVYRPKITNFVHEKSNKMIKDIVFDFGGVLTLLDTEKALQCFRNIGIEKPEDYINAYLQNGPFFSLENGDITADKFCEELSAIAGRTITYEQAKEEFKATQEEILESIADGYDDVEDILLGNLGLEMDYIFDFI